MGSILLWELDPTNSINDKEPSDISMTLTLRFIAIWELSEIIFEIRNHNWNIMDSLINIL